MAHRPHAVPGSSLPTPSVCRLRLSQNPAHRATALWSGRSNILLAAFLLFHYQNRSMFSWPMFLIPGSTEVLILLLFCGSFRFSDRSGHRPASDRRTVRQYRPLSVRHGIPRSRQPVRAYRPSRMFLRLLRQIPHCMSSSSDRLRELLSALWILV